jgi:hypoxia-inducible factor 1-alpha inhibitor (HIF hydroxylase)
MKMSSLKANVLWVGMRGVVTPGHFDEAHNFFSQIRGRKRFNLFSPIFFPSMYPFPFHHPADRQSRVDFYRPDHLTYPRFSEAKGVTVILEPGDVLYLPPYWWHHVESLTETIGINFWLEMKQAEIDDLTYPLPAGQLVAIRR